MNLFLDDCYDLYSQNTNYVPAKYVISSTFPNLQGTGDKKLYELMKSRLWNRSKTRFGCGGKCSTFLMHENYTVQGVIHKRCPHKFGNFWDLPPSFQASPHLVDDKSPPPPSSPCLCGRKAGIIWNIATCEQFTLKGKKTWSFWYWMHTHVCSY